MISRAMSVVALFGLAACGPREITGRHCYGKGGEAYLMQEDRFENKMTLVHKSIKGVIKKYSLGENSPYANDELIVGESGVFAACKNGRPDSRWKLQR